MKRFMLLIALVLCTSFLSISAQERRPIDNRHPMWMIHIDVWNNADPQKIIDLIPEDIKPFVCLNLSLSCQYDTSVNMYKKPQNAILTYKSWASVCCRNNMWFTCQPASGGHTHIQDDDLETFESFFKEYKNFLGWNYAEQFWGFDERGDKSSSSQTSRIELFSKLVPMHHEYGGFLTISFCGNIWSHGLNPCGMLKRNSDFLKACRDYSEAMLFLYKYTTSSCWYNNESVTLGPFISGLCKNYGVRYDNCGWNGAAETILGKDDSRKYPGAVGIAPVLEQMTLNGACVWDGPELIWTEDFYETNRSTVDGYTRRNWTTYPNFRNIWIDMFRKVIDGTIHIPSREEVIGRTKILMMNNIPENQDNTSIKINAFAAPEDLYDGLYKQNDPFNKGKGYCMDNMLYYKKTGRYQTIPIVISLYDDLAKSVPVRITRTSYNGNIRWANQAAKIEEFNKLYPEVSTGDLFVARHHNQLTCYYPYSYLNSKTTASAEIPLKYNSCEKLNLQFAKFSSGLVHEYEDHIDFYLNNYRSDTTTVQIDIITITGAKTKPEHVLTKRAECSGRAVGTWDEATGVYTCKVIHNGPLDLRIDCKGDQQDLLDDYVDVTPLTDLPLQPGNYYGDLIIEAEDMDYKNVTACVTDAWNDGWGAYRTIKGHAAMGFVKMGTNTQGSLRNPTQINFPGTYTISVKYQSAASSTLDVEFGTHSERLNIKATGSGWGYATFTAEATKGINNLTITNKAGKDMLIDNVTFTPDSSVGIDKVESEWNDKSSAVAKEYYNISGLRLDGPQKGLNIVKMSNGKTVKVYY